MVPCSRCWRLVACVLTGLAIGCGGAGGEPTPVTLIAKVAGDAQDGIVGQPLADPLLVLLTENNAPLAGATIHWLTTLTEGALDPDSSVTDANGLASAQWTLGHFVGTNRVTAKVSGGSEPEVNFTAQAFADQPAALAKVTGDNQTGVVNSVLKHLQVRVMDRFENPVPGVDVEWSGSGASLTAARITTDPSGISSALVTLGGTPGPATIAAAVDGLSGSPQIFTATVTSPPEAAVLRGQQVTVQLTD